MKTQPNTHFNTLWDSKPIYADVNHFITYISTLSFETVKTNKKQVYYNIPCSFDIETTSFEMNGEKCAIMYEWTFCICGCSVYGRTWDEFSLLLNKINTLFNKGCLLVYVHNLEYEFQFMYKRYIFSKVFALDNRRVCYAKYKNIEFRCSYILSGVSLEVLGNQLNTYTIKKLVGALNYNLIHTPLTPLTNTELSYCINDCLVVVAYIQEMIEQYDGKIFNIPLTKTGKVRKVCRDKCKKTRDYYKLMNILQLDVEEYKILKLTFAGGFTHANVRHSCCIHENVYSLDECSAYPSVMLCEQFPMSKGIKVKVKSIKHLEKLCNEYCCIFCVCFKNIVSTQFVNPISKSKCVLIENCVENNGRIMKAEKLATYITNVDYDVYKHFYKWDSMAVKDCYIYDRGYLPKPLLECILEFYANKTSLKGVEGKEIEYSIAKELLNSMYGMCVTDPYKPEYTIGSNNEWVCNLSNIEDTINSYNKSKNRFLFYAWGVFITAYARRNLFSAINELQNDFIYCDTDSVKFLNYEQHKEWFTRYNEYITRKIKHSCKINNLDYNKTTPKTKDGTNKPLGVWEVDGIYRLFKTLGAKRYAYFVGDKFMFTLAGCGKYKGSEYLQSISKTDLDCMSKFNNELYIPPEHTGKLTHTYIDEEINGVIYDYNGIPYEYNELSFVHLAPCEFTLCIAEKYLKLINVIREECIL